MNTAVLVEGNEIPATLAIACIRVTHAAGELASAEIEIAGASTEAGLIPDADGLVFVLGKTIEIRLGHHGDAERVFAGVIVARRATLAMSGGALVVECAHPLYRSALSARNRTWTDTRDSECIATLCAEHGVPVQVAPSGVHHRVLVQAGRSDWEFMRDRAVASGMLLLTDGEGLQAGPLKPAGAALLELLVGVSVRELALETDLRAQPTGVEGQAWDAMTQELVRIRGEEPALPGFEQQRGIALARVHGQMRQLDLGASDEHAMELFASSQLLGARLSAKSGRVQVNGTANLVPGQWVSLRGAGALLDGELLVTRVEHRVQQGEWSTEIGVGNPFGAQQDAPMRGVAMHSLRPGIVEALQNDPDGEGRIQVRLPMLGEGATPLWARLLSSDAGDNRGAVFAPEIGDEVLVGFAGDASQPVVMGSLHSSARPSPMKLTDANPRKGYFSRSGLQLVFDDEGRVLTLATPTGNQLVLSDGEAGIRLQDAHGNRIAMDATGIHIESARDLHLKAGTQLEVEGGAGAVLKSAGQVTIRGAIVQIN